MTALPTCWYCPECGMVFNYQLEAEAGHVGGLPGFLECENEAIVEVPLIPPGTPLPVILDALGHTYREGWLVENEWGWTVYDLRDEDHPAVGPNMLVVPAPVEASGE